jgi:putative membrane-bound dehydrogenase-like protein
MTLVFIKRIVPVCVTAILFGLHLAPARAQQAEATPAQGDAAAADPPVVHKLLFLGDRAGHRPQQRAESLIPVMRKRGISVEYTEDVEVLAQPKLNEYDGLILYANIVRISPEQEAGLLKFVADGKGFIPLHCATFCFQNSEDVIALMGAQFQRHGGEVFKTVITEPEHPIMKGWGGFSSWDETYVHTKHNEDRTVIERREQGMQADGQTSEPWTWVRTHGKGRVFYTAWGHDMRTWTNPGFLNLLERGIRWACGGDPALVPAIAFQEAPPGSEEPPRGPGRPGGRRGGGRRGGQGAPGAGGNEGGAGAPGGNAATAGQGAQAEAPAYAEHLAARFVPPAMIDGGGKAADFKFEDVGPAVPHYRPRPGQTPGRGPRGGGLEHYDMQQAVTPEQSQTYAVRPEGFEIDLYASEANLGPKPISMTWDARGRVWVCETIDYPNEWRRNGEGRDRIRICEDTDGDGKADKFTVFAENLSIPYSIAFYRGGIIVQNGAYTTFLKDTDGDEKADVRKVLITGWGMGDTHGAVSNFQYGLDNWIYAMQGYNSSTPKFTDGDGVEHEVPTFRQGFFRFRLDGKDDPSVAELEFMRSTNNNTWGLGISEEGLVFGSTANGNPSVFMPVPNRYYERVRGWSGDTLGTIADTPRFSAVTDAVRQVDNFGAYTAGAGHALYTARTYPKQWWNRTAFVCEPTGHLTGVFVLERDGAGYRSSSPMNLFASRDEWSAPIQAEVGPDGNVWMLDWYNFIVQHNPTPPGFETGVGAAYESELRDKKFGRIYRIKYVGDEGKGAPAPGNLETASPQELVAALKHPTKLWRLHGQRLLVERGELDVIPALVELVNDRNVDEIGLNAGAIHAIGALQGLVAQGADEPQQSAVAAAIRGALSHPSPGVRRVAITALPKDDASLTALFDSGVLTDADSQVQLAAVLALADLPAGARGAETIAEMLGGAAGEDRWMADALTSAAAMHGVDFVKVLAAKYPRTEGESAADLPEAVVNSVAIVGEHLARGGLDGAALGTLLESLAAADNRLAAPFLASISSFWPEDGEVQLPQSAEAAIARLLNDTPFESRSDLLRLARLWNAGNTAELQKAHSDALKAMIENADLGDEERVAAAESWVRFDPDSGEVGSEIVGTISPQTPLPLLEGLLNAASQSNSAEFAEDLVSLYETLSPQGRLAVLNQLLRQPETTTALLGAIAEKRINAGTLSLEQIAALRNHANEAIRARATELLAESGTSPDPERQKVYAELLSVADAPGNAAHGKELFTKHCAVCHMHSGVGETIAPDLTGMFVHPKKDILANIIDPSKDVESNYRTYSVISNGLSYNGLFSGESRTTVTVVDSTGKRTVVQRDEIDEIFASEKSLMPDGFEKTLTKTDLSDVLEFLATRQKFVPLRLSSVATATSGPPQFGGQFGGRGQGRGDRGRGQGAGRGQGGRGQQGQAGGRGQNAGRGQGGRGQGRGNRGGFGGRFQLLTFEDWKPVTVEGVPFTLINPQDGAVKNVLLFGSDASFFSRGLPTAVRLPAGMPAKKLHLLSGVSIGGHPEHPDPTVSLKVRINYAGGDSEEIELKNGEHFANYQRREDVPKSSFAFAMGEQQMRHIVIEPKKSDVIVDIEFIKGDDPTVPIVLAVTAEVE